MGALEYVDVPGYAAIVFRRTFTDLSLPGAVMARSKEWLTNTDAVWNEQRKQWTFPSGATLQFAFMKDDGDELRYQSAEFQYVGFDELTQFPEEQYTYLFSRVRRPELSAETPEAIRANIAALGKVPLRMRAASNPGGVGHGWVKKRFPIDGKPRGNRVFIPAKIADNPHLDADSYRKGLAHLGETLRLQLEEGDWSVAEGMAFQVGAVHRVESFELRDSFERFEAADYGLNGAPWCLWAVDYDGNLIAVEMLYKRDMLPSELCPLVVEKRKAGWGFGHPTYLDPSVWHRTGQRNKWGAPAMLADEFTDNGIPVIPANNDPRAGLIRLRELLAPDPARRFPSWHPQAGEYGSPRVFFVRGSCDRIVDELENAPLQPIDKQGGGEIVNPGWESGHGHAVAMTRYAVMTRPAASEEPEKPLTDPDEIRRWMQQELLKAEQDRWEAKIEDAA
jgi:hypothetical protein